MSYEGKHRDDATEASELSAELDRRAMWDALYPCRHHHPRHSAFVCKMRDAA